jgi:hypothetical protein
MNGLKKIICLTVAWFGVGSGVLLAQDEMSYGAGMSLGGLIETPPTYCEQEMIAVYLPPMIADDFSSGTDMQSVPELSFTPTFFTDASSVPDSSSTLILLAASFGILFAGPWCRKRSLATEFVENR